jgi:hypothetical protein
MNQTKQEILVQSFFNIIFFCFDQLFKQRYAGASSKAGNSIDDEFVKVALYDSVSKQKANIGNYS